MTRSPGIDPCAISCHTLATRGVAAPCDGCYMGNAKSAPRRRVAPRRRLLTPTPALGALDATQHMLQERIKELECLYAISSMRETHLHNVERFLQGVVNYLPRAWQYPEFASARIRHGNREYLSDNFRQGPWRMVADVRVDQRHLGSVEVFYTRGVPALPQGPFLKEEQALLGVVAERVGTAAVAVEMREDLEEAHRVLKTQHQALQDTNTALRTVLSRLEDEKHEVRASIIANIQKIVMPIVFELELGVAGRQRSYVTLLRQSLQDIASPFLTQMARQHLELTPAEIAISAMIRNGLSTKEIAQLRCISPATIRRHRENIRRKLGLQNRRVNLVTYLQSTGSEQPALTPGAQLPAASAAVT